MSKRTDESRESRDESQSAAAPQQKKPDASSTKPNAPQAKPPDKPLPRPLTAAEIPRLSRYLAANTHTTKAHAVELLRRMTADDLARLRRTAG